MNLVAISAETPEESTIMKERKKAPFLFIADQDLELIDAFDVRTNTIARPGFILLHQGVEVWRHTEFKYLRQEIESIINRLKKVQKKILSTSTHIRDRSNASTFK